MNLEKLQHLIIWNGGSIRQRWNESVKTSQLQSIPKFWKFTFWKSQHLHGSSTFPENARHDNCRSQQIPSIGLLRFVFVSANFKWQYYGVTQAALVKSRIHYLHLSVQCITQMFNSDNTNQLLWPISMTSGFYSQHWSDLNKVNCSATKTVMISVPKWMD
jgi:hypothetical protein